MLLGVCEKNRNALVVGTGEKREGEGSATNAGGCTESKAEGVAVLTQNAMVQGRWRSRHCRCSRGGGKRSRTVRRKGG